MACCGSSVEAHVQVAESVRKRDVQECADECTDSYAGTAYHRNHASQQIQVSRLEAIGKDLDSEKCFAGVL